MTFEATEREAGEFFLSVVEETWIREIKRANIYYTLVIAGKIIAHLQAKCGEIHALNVPTLKNEMQLYHLNIEGISEYINELKNAQAKVEQANTSITDTTLFIIATSAVINNEQFSRSKKDWEELDAAQRMWEEWKTTYHVAAKTAAIKKKLLTEKSNLGRRIARHPHYLH